jgi:hypothetical protein
MVRRALGLPEDDHSFEAFCVFVGAAQAQGMASSIGRRNVCCDAHRIAYWKRQDARAEVKAPQAIVTEKGRPVEESQTASAPRLRKWGKTRSASKFHAH